MPENPYGNISLEDVVRTGTLDGVNPPKTPEEQEVLDALINFHTYTQASAEIDASFDSLMDDLKMDDLSKMMEDFREEMEAELMASEMAKMGLSPEDLADKITDKQKENIKKATERLEAIGQSLTDEVYFS